MLQDIPQVQGAPISQLKLTHFVGLMSFTNTEVAKFFAQDGMTWPKKVQTQYVRFSNAYQTLDEAYKKEKYSLYTEELKEADAACDKYYMGIKKVVDGWLHFDLDDALKTQALKLKQSMDNYDIDVTEDYLGENNKLQQWLQDVNGSAQLQKAVKALNLGTYIEQLSEKVTQVRSLITERSVRQPEKGATQTAREAMEPEYRLLVKILNADALCDDDEEKYTSLFTTLNRNIDYLKNVVLAHQGAAKPDDPDGDDKGDDDKPDDPSDDEKDGDEKAG